MSSFPILHKSNPEIPRELRETEPEGFRFMHSAPELQIKGTMNPPSPSPPQHPPQEEPEKGVQDIRVTTSPLPTEIPCPPTP